MSNYQAGEFEAMSPISPPQIDGIPGQPTWSLASGTLHNGLSLDSFTGVISGTPTQTGTRTFRLRATIGGTVIESNNFTINVLETCPFTAEGLSGETTCSCPSNEPFTFAGWGGPDFYTDDSDICIAAVHAGVLPFQAGGIVTVDIAPGLLSYTGSVRNGVATQSWGAHPRSFFFVED